MPIEVGCRGFSGQSLYRAYNTLGINGAKRRRAISNTIEAAERASRWFWIKRGDPWGAATCHLDISPGLINLDWIAWVRVSDVERPKTPYDPGYITDDVSMYSFNQS